MMIGPPVGRWGMAGSVTVLSAKPGGMLTVRLSGFDIGSSVPPPEHLSYLENRVAPILRGGGSSQLTGLTSRTGSWDFNQALSRRRAEAITAALRRMAGEAFKVAFSLGLGE